jgi:hypothetical protein
VHALRCCCLLERDRSVRREQVERAVGSVLVVVPTVDAENVFEVSAAEDEDLVETMGADGAHPAFGVGVRVRRLDRRADPSIPSERNTSSKAALNFLSRSRDEEQDIEPLKERCLYCEEVASKGARRMLAQERAHDERARSGAGWRPAASSILRTEVAETGDAETLELTDDPAGTPSDL